ncbi:MAG: glycosyltransferase [candidate division KSB1 bacterium]|nr:glycosyltransferase [candidate division KSB1 bacterium]MDZ7345813.1 glycosyltransferase [candidate division KSB1 bacterium]
MSHERLKKPIKIVRLQSRICIGGPSLHTELLSKYLPAFGYRNILIGGALDPGEFCRMDELRAAGYDVRCVSSMQRSTSIIADLAAVYHIYRLLRKEKPLIVCTHTAKAGAAGRIAALLAGVPLIFHTFHGHVFHGYFPKIVTKVFLLIERLLARFTTCLVAISPSQLHELSSVYHVAPASRFRVIRLGFELEPYLQLKPTEVLKKKLGLKPDAVLIGIIGRLVPIKNHLSALRILQILLQKDHRYHLLIVGDGPERANLEAYVQKDGLEKHVHFTGWRTDMLFIYEGIDLLLLTSLNEGTPVTIIEAMAAGVPVVASRVGGVPDLIKHGVTGLSFAVDDEKAAADCVEKAINDRTLRMRLVEGARRFVAGTYHYRRMIHEMDVLYRHFLQKIM